MVGMFSFVSAIASLFKRRPLAKNLDWLYLPPWTSGKTDIQVPRHRGIDEYQRVLVTHDRSSAAILRQIKIEDVYSVNLENNSCTCREWEQGKKTFPVLDLRRICSHIARAISYRQEDFHGEWNEWTRRILYAIETQISYGLYPAFTSAFFNSGTEQFLAIYDNTRGYVELYSEHGGCFGYDSSRNRWANGQGPSNPLAVKRILRPWIRSLDIKFKNE
jgi:SWIM zinc finger